MRYPIFIQSCKNVYINNNDIASNSSEGMIYIADSLNVYLLNNVLLVEDETYLKTNLIVLFRNLNTTIIANDFLRDNLTSNSSSIRYYRNFTLFYIVNIDNNVV